MKIPLFSPWWSLNGDLVWFRKWFIYSLKLLVGYNAQSHLIRIIHMKDILNCNNIFFSNGKLQLTGVRNINQTCWRLFYYYVFSQCVNQFKEVENRDFDVRKILNDFKTDALTVKNISLTVCIFYYYDWSYLRLWYSFKN